MLLFDLSTPVLDTISFKIYLLNHKSSKVICQGFLLKYFKCIAA